MDKKELYAYIDENKEIFEKLSDEIWEYAEISLKEHKSAAAYIKLLEELGFRVETGLAGVETAFSGTFGSGKPVIGILGEFDALSGLSQKPGMTVHDELISGGSGHGCGHNLLGAGSLAAAYGIKKYLEEKGKGCREESSAPDMEKELSPLVMRYSRKFLTGEMVKLFE